MYDIGQIRTQLITHIQSYIKTPVVICVGGYDHVKEEWVLSRCNNSIESVYYTGEWYVNFKICQLEPGGVFGYYEAEDSHETCHITYQDLGLEALYEISNFIEEQGIEMPHHIKTYRDREDFKLE